MTSSTGWSGLIVFGSPPRRSDGFAHRRQIDDRRDAGEVLQQDARRRERDLLGRRGLGLPPGEGFDVGGADGPAILGAEEIFEQDLDRERQARDGRVRRIQGVEPVDAEGLTQNGEAGLAIERVKAHGKSSQGVGETSSTGRAPHRRTPI